MEIATIVFLSSGAFLGWSLGANHLGNVFGTAVGTRMISFMTAAVLCSIFVVLGSVISGAGPAETVVGVGAINALAGAFMVAFSAAVAVYWMTKLGMPVSTTETIIGAIVGWNLFTGSFIDADSVIKIMVTWVVCPFLSAGISIVLYITTRFVLRVCHPHMLRLDAYTRIALILAGSFGAYSLGANNIANVMGVFVPVNPFADSVVGGLFAFSGVQKLFLIGGLAIAVGVMTYSHRVVHTVGRSLFSLTPVTAWVVVMSHSLVLFLFASEGLEQWLAGHGLPTIPLVPVSSSQAVVGAVLGIGIVKDWRAIRWGMAVRIASAWVTSPIIAGIISFVGLFIVQNVFNQNVYSPTAYSISQAVTERLTEDGVEATPLLPLIGTRFASTASFVDAIDGANDYTRRQTKTILDLAKIDNIVVDATKLDRLSQGLLTPQERAAVVKLDGRRYAHDWLFARDLAAASPEWLSLPETTVNKLANRALDAKRRALYNLFRTPPAS